MTLFSRADRVSGRIKKELTETLQKDVSDPRLDMVTITSVNMTNDLRIARIYFTMAASQKMPKEAEAGFKSARKYLKRKLADKLMLRYMPDLEFYYDNSFDHASHINALLKAVQKNDETDNSEPTEE
ncbi:MAG: 30S ribosome-binding factor RbfA [Desulfobacterales bacterium]